MLLSCEILKGTNEKKKNAIEPVERNATVHRCQRDGT